MFFALWPDEETRARLAAAAALIPIGDSFRAYRTKPEKLHLTLAFLGMIEPRQSEAAQKAADYVAVPAFALTLDAVGYFEGAKAAWIGSSALNPQLAQLKAQLDRELLRFGLQVPAEPYVPHVTCVRALRSAPDAPAFEIGWNVKDFVLVKSLSTPRGSVYKIVRRWVLR
jgi:2'-5' RNA ligase